MWDISVRTLVNDSWFILSVFSKKLESLYGGNEYNKKGIICNTNWGNILSPWKKVGVVIVSHCHFPVQLSSMKKIMLSSKAIWFRVYLSYLLWHNWARDQTEWPVCNWYCDFSPQNLCNLILLRGESKCSISLINAEAVIFHQYLSGQARGGGVNGDPIWTWSIQSNNIMLHDS